MLHTAPSRLLETSPPLIRVPAPLPHRYRRVVLAEDDGQLRDNMATALRHDGYPVVEARDGLELLDRLEREVREGRRADVIIVADIHMPELSGLDVLCALACARCRVPMILMTAFGDDLIRRDALEMGARAVLDKPFDMGTLRAAVEAAAR